MANTQYRYQPVWSSKQDISFSYINDLQSELIPKAVVESISVQLQTEIIMWSCVITILQHYTLLYTVMSCGYAQTWVLDNI